jgi:hypothetical protein
MPLLAGVYEAYEAASHNSKHELVIAWLVSFVDELATRLPASRDLPTGDKVGAPSKVGDAGLASPSKWRCKRPPRSLEAMQVLV